jgi:hypothetical protein
MALSEQIGDPEFDQSQQWDISVSGTALVSHGKVSLALADATIEEVAGNLAQVGRPADRCTLDRKRRPGGRRITS